MQSESIVDRVYRRFGNLLVFYIAGTIALDRDHGPLFLMIAMMGAALSLELAVDWTLLCVDRWYAIKRLFTRLTAKSPTSP